MFGGYLTFQGIDGRGRWNKTPVEAALPVTCLPYDDRVEVPDGFKPVVTGPADHPILQGLGTDWPALLGANEVILKDGADLLATLPEEEGGHPLLVTGEYGKGRTLAWTSDVGPHWLPNAFVQWPGYAPALEQRRRLADPADLRWRRWRTHPSSRPAASARRSAASPRSPMSMSTSIAARCWRSSATTAPASRPS